ncbi:uncharacterized protein HmgZ isoform X3 [Drosophila bipectinata]|uniref:uncharacterized protein HmgZ isoform X3 n=1 Tax=Drosophila bipectinata TaxID=42026 RepID=UPI0038B3104A
MKSCQEEKQDGECTSYGITHPSYKYVEYYGWYSQEQRNGILWIRILLSVPHTQYTPCECSLKEKLPNFR